MICSADELIAITGKRRCRAQAKVLDALGIRHLARPDGSLAVSRTHVETQMGVAVARVRVPADPNWKAMPNVQATQR